MQLLKIFFLSCLALYPKLVLSDIEIKNISITTTPRNTKQLIPQNNLNNFGMPGLITTPDASTLPDGEIIFYNNFHPGLARTGFTFQLTPNVGLSFRYSGHGRYGPEASGRKNHDRSFDLDFKLINETNFIPALSLGLRDFIGTGWYSSEYVVATKNIGPISGSAGIGFGRLSGRDKFSNPLASINSSFKNRKNNGTGLGGTLGNINWFQGHASPFFGLKYDYDKKTSVLLEYSPDLMERESEYLDIDSPLNIGISHNLNQQISINAQYLHGTTFALGANLQLNPSRSQTRNGFDKAPIPLRKRNPKSPLISKTNISSIKKLLEADKFVVNDIQVEQDNIRIEVENKKFRSTAQALGRISSVLQRLTSDKTDYAIIVLFSKQFPVASYRLNLQKLSNYQNSRKELADFEEIIVPQSTPSSINYTSIKSPKFKSILGPYLDYKLFDPLQPIRAELGLKLDLKYRLPQNFELVGAIKKSLVTDFDKIIRTSNSTLPHVLSDYAIYDKKGQSGHLENLKLHHRTKVSNNIYSSISAGFLEPMYAGISGELLHKLPNSNFAIGVDLSAVQMREYDMMFNLRDYKTVTGHLNLYYDAGNSVDLEMNIGRYLAKDLGVTTKLSRRFGNGWSVGAYATFTDVPFDTFGEGSFDKGFHLNIPIDWLIGVPTQSAKTFPIKPITRDGGAILGSSKSIYRFIRKSNKSEVTREYGRFLK